MPSPAQKFAVFGDSAGWSDARATGLDPRGPALALARLPGPPAAGAVDLAGHYAPDLEGFAVGLSGEVAFGAGANPSLVLVDTSCLDRRITFDIGTCPDDARLQSITGLAVGCNRLFLADEDAGRVLVFRLPGLELSASWERPFDAPRRVALDGAERVYVLDVGQQRVIRVHPSGRLDPAYDTGMIAALAAGLDLFVATDGTAFVTVDGVGDIHRYSPSGTTLVSLRPPEEAPGLLPGAMAGHGKRLYVADRASGALWVYDLRAARWLASLPRFRAPVVGLAADGEGHLYVRTGADTRYLRLDARSVHVSRGLLEAGPLDAGEGCAWMRVHVDAEVPDGTRVRVETALAGDSKPSAPLPWQTALSLDALVHTPEPMGIPPESAARFLWIRVHLETDDPSRSPELREIVAETPGDDYLARLPVVYARRDAEGDGFLRKWLEAFRAELGGRELEIAKLAQRIDPETAPADHLEWLASWVAFDLPPGADTAEKRKLLSAAHALYGRRGTVEGLREMVRIHTGVDCEIVESFRSRRLWALNGPARLGFDTGLLPALPDGMVVPGPSLPDASLQGLRAEYFLDDHLGTPADLDSGRDCFEPLRPRQSLIDPDGKLDSFQTKALTNKPFSVLWTGQIRARRSGLYTFYFIHKGGARLYVDNQLLIDSWKPGTNGELRGYIPLSAERWYIIRIECWTDNNDAPPTLSWSCREHPRQIVPQECLYAVFDDSINPDARPKDGSPEAMVVGETVVGAHGPLAAEDFGAPLFDDTAHRFTVRVKAAAVKAPGKLEEIRAVLDAEKPAHTDYHLCVIEPTFLVGVQARIGIDAYVALDPPPGRYGEGHLGLDARLGNSPEHDDGTLRVAESLRIGPTAILR